MGDRKVMAPQEAANAIRDQHARDASSRMDPNDRHRINFVKDVCGHLGVEPTLENVEHVARLLQENDIDPLQHNEYPKWVYEGDDPRSKRRAIVRNEDEEHAFHDDPAKYMHEQVSPAPATPRRPEDAPVYQPDADYGEPGAHNRPNMPAPVASPVSDNRKAQRTPNPQPGDPFNRTGSVTGTEIEPGKEGSSPVPVPERPTAQQPAPEGHDETNGAADDDVLHEEHEELLNEPDPTPEAETPPSRPNTRPGARTPGK